MGTIFGPNGPFNKIGSSTFAKGGVYHSMGGTTFGPNGPMVRLGSVTHLSGGGSICRTGNVFHGPKGAYVLTGSILNGPGGRSWTGVSEADVDMIIDSDR